MPEGLQGESFPKIQNRSADVLELVFSGWCPMIPIDAVQIQARADEIHQWLTEPRPPVQQCLLSSRDELWCEAQFSWLPAAVCADALHAFVWLWWQHLAGIEEFDPDAPDFDFWMNSLQANQGYGQAADFAPLSETVWLQETREVCQGIMTAIARVRQGLPGWGRVIEIPAGPLDPNRLDSYWGIFFNGQRLAEATDPLGLLPGQFLDGLAIRNLWNQRELFVQTTEAFLLFTWSTGA